MYRFYFHISLHTFINNLVLFVNPLSSSILVLGLSFFFGKKIRGIWVLFISFISTVLLLSDIMYYRFYTDFITFPVITELPDISGVGRSTAALIHPVDAFLALDLVFLAIWLKTGRWTITQVTGKYKKKALGLAAALLVVNIGVVAVEYPHFFKAFYNHKAIVKAFGVFNYHAYDLVSQLGPVAERAFSSDDDLDQIKDDIKQNEIPPNPKFFGKEKGKNIILVSMESTQNFVINRKVNGQEVTPFLNQLIGNSYYFDHFYHQTEQGKTSDAEFIIDNSLYPLPSGSVFVRYPQNKYKALPEILGKQGYSSAVFHGNDPTFWNRDEMYPALGYDHFYAAPAYHMTDENTINYGLKDIPFFNQSMQYLTELPQPFYAKFIMLSNHFPFLIDKKDEMINPPHTEIPLVNRYFVTVRYEDEALKGFFQRLKETGLYDNSIIILYGDHYGIPEAYEQGLEEIFGKAFNNVDRAKLQRVPLIIHLPGQTKGKTLHTIAGQIDIRPTILHLLGIRTDSLVHFGHGLFAKDRKNVAYFRNGAFVTKDYVFYGNTCYDTESEKPASLEKCKPWFERRDTDLADSDTVIYKNLLQFDQ